MTEITTAGDDARTDEQPRRDERAGLYLAGIVAFLLPSLIVVAFFISSTSDDNSEVESVNANTGLAQVDVDTTALRGTDFVTADDDPEVETTEPADDETGDVEGGETVDVEVRGTTETRPDDADGSAPNAGDGSTQDDGVTSPAPATASNEESEPAVQVSATGAVRGSIGEAPDDDAAAPTTGEDAPDTTVRSTTTSSTASTTTVQGIDASTSSSSSSSTTSTSTTTTIADPQEEPAEFSQRIDVGRIGETTLALRFKTTEDTRYTVIVRAGDELVKSESGDAVGGRTVNEIVSGLTPGTDYTVHVVLATSPPVVSRAVTFRTSGGEPAPAEVQVELLNPRVVDLQATRFEINYESNICANGSFVIREKDGGIVGRNSGQAAGCTTRHLAIPGYWTAALKPSTTYVVTLTVEANGAGQGKGNTASTTVTVTTSS